MITFDVKKAYFDAQKVQSRLDKKVERGLSTIGRYVRKTIQFNMKSRKKPALPGEPPHAHKNKFLKQFILWAVDMKKKSVVIGVLLRQQTASRMIPRLMEIGGSVTLPPTKRHKTAKTLRYRPHPFTKPALKANEGKLAEIIAGTRVIQ